MQEQALSDIRVIDLSQGVAGPYCTKLLADYGAEVIKVEPPGDGDPCRCLGPFPNDVPQGEKSGLFLHLNTNKKSVTLDIAQASGRSILKKLLSKADVLVESYPPGYLPGLALGYDDLKEELPDLVYTSITPFGQTGPYRDYQGNSITCMALAGLMYITGDPEREPLSTGGHPADYFAGVNAWVAILAALAYRAEQGSGQHVDLSILESLSCADEYNTAMYSFFGAIRRRYYSRHLFAYPMDIFPCRDGQVVVCATGWDFGTRMAILLEQPELESNPLFLFGWLRAMHWREFDELILSWLQSHDWQEILDRAQELRLPFAPVLTCQTLLSNPHLRERGFWVELEHPQAGRITHTGAPFLMNETPAREGLAPLLGQDNQEILSQAGLSEEHLTILRQQGVV